MFRKLLGIALILGGIALGIWLGIVYGLVGGITQVVNGLKATPANSSDIAWGIVRVIFADVMGIGSGAICIWSGFGMLMFGGRRR